LSLLTNGHEIEKAKTECGKLHFIDALQVDYKIGNSLKETLE